MNRYINHLDETDFTLISNGIKKSHVVIGNSPIINVSVNDKIIFLNDKSEQIEVEVLAVRRYPTYEEMLNENLNKVHLEREHNLEALMFYSQFKNHNLFEIIVVDF